MQKEYYRILCEHVSNFLFLVADLKNISCINKDSIGEQLWQYLKF